MNQSTQIRPKLKNHFFPICVNVKIYVNVCFFFVSRSLKFLKLIFSEWRKQLAAMETFVNKRSCTDDAPTISQRKKMKLEREERMKQEEDAEEDEDAAASEFSHPVPWQKIEAEGLDCDYALLFSKKEADHLFNQLEEEVMYSTGTSPFFSVKL